MVPAVVLFAAAVLVGGGDAPSAPVRARPDAELPAASATPASEVPGHIVAAAGDSDLEPVQTMGQSADQYSSRQGAT